MPTTVNGIGTHYYGRNNRTWRQGACQSCRRVGNLESYDTRLWFVVIFIPIIPLGRKRIIDQCPSCRRHFVAAADTYETSRQLQISGSMDEFRRAPAPESALRAHAQLLAFRDFDQANEFRRTVLDRFPAHARLCAGLASQLDQFSVHDEATKLFEKALELDPDMPEARIGMARRRMAEGELDEARDLLDFLEVPGASRQHSLGPLDLLSAYYQKKGRHAEALSLAEHLVRELPQAGQQHPFRAFVKKSEKALGVETSILPPIERTLRGLFRGADSPYPAWQRRLFWAGLAASLLAGVLVVNNEYIRRHRTLHVVNACGQPVQVHIDDGPPTTVSTLGKLPVSEGRHRVQLGGPVDELLDVDMRTSYFDRWFKKPAWIINPGGEAVLDEATVYYAANPQPSSHRLSAGESLVVRDHVDYVFEDLPQSLDVGGKDRVLAKQAMRWVQADDEQLFPALLQKSRQTALDFAERRLRRQPGHLKLLREYVSELVNGDAARIEGFLESGLVQRPVIVEWHRAYQTVAEANGHEQGLAERYDRALAADPGNAGLIYLRGRFESAAKDRERYYLRAIEADPKLAWPWFALGSQAGSEGRWDDCLAAITKARQLGIDEETLRDGPHLARMARGEAKGLVGEYRAALLSNPMDFTTLNHLCDALAASGQAAQIIPEVSSWQNRIPPGLQPQFGIPMRAVALYQAGKPNESEKLCQNSMILANSTVAAQAMLALGKGKELAANLAFEKTWDNPWLALALCLDLGLDGLPDQAARWRERAIKKLDSMWSSYRETGRLLAAAEPPPVEDLLKAGIEAENKALVFALLAERFPTRRAEYLDQAARFNVLRKPPYLLVQRAIQRTDAKAP